MTLEDVSGHDWKGRVIAHILQNGDNLDFTRYFWKGWEPLEKGCNRKSQICPGNSICTPWRRNCLNCANTECRSRTVRHWSILDQNAKTRSLSESFCSDGCPQDDLVWLNTECSGGYALPIGRFVQVQTKVAKWDEVEAVLSQPKPLHFGPQTFSRRYLFGFLYGIVIGDGSKIETKDSAQAHPVGAQHEVPSKSPSRRLHLRLRPKSWTTNAPHRRLVKARRQATRLLRMGFVIFAAHRFAL